MEQIFGNIVPMIISSATVRIMKSICDISMKTLCGGIMTNYIPKNKVPLPYGAVAFSAEQKFTNKAPRSFERGAFLFLYLYFSLRTTAYLCPI